MKKIVYIVGGIIVLLLAAIVILPFVIDVNRFRPDIERLMGEALNRKVSIGNIQLSILSGGVAVADLTIADDPAFSRDAFLTAKSVTVGVEMWPLIMSRVLNVTGLTIDEPQATLLRNGAGTWNFSTIGASPSGARPAPAQQQAASHWFRRRGAGTGDSELCHPQRRRERRECRVESAIAQVRAGESDGVESFLHDAISL